MRALVTGATGFLGYRLALRLAQTGWEVTGIGRREGRGERLSRAGVRFIRADLGERERIVEACAGQDAVFHCAALSAPWGAYRAFHAANVTGTEHVLAGCMQHGTGRLVHVSTPSVCFGAGERLDVSESEPLPRRQASAYARSKLAAECAVLGACRQGLDAVIVRPRALFGPGDSAIVPKLIAANGSRGIPLLDGGRALVDLTYVDNAVDALLLCQAAPARAAGRIYHISNGEPMPFGDAVRRLFVKLDEPLRLKKLPYWAAYGIAGLMETASRLVPSLGEPLLTRAMAGMVGRSQTLDISRARAELGYRPAVSVEEGMARYAIWLQEKGEGVSADEL